MASGPAQAVKDHGGAKSCVRPGDEDFFGQNGKDGRKLCVRHKQMANQGVNAKLQTALDKFPVAEREAITTLWSTFSVAAHPKRKLILEGILTMCCFSQLSHMSDALTQIIRIDPFSLLPREVSLRVLGYLDAISLGKAAQVSKGWKALADDDLLWRRMCGQHIERKCEKCGWGLPLLERRRLRSELDSQSPSAAFTLAPHDDSNPGHPHAHAGPSKLVTRVEALGGHAHLPIDGTPPSTIGLECDGPRALGKRPASESSERDSKRAKTSDGSDSETDMRPAVAAAVAVPRDVRLTRPWKDVYCERLVVERNWRKGRCRTKTLKGHTNGVMCLQYHHALTSPSHPVLITGSYDRTARVWNLDTGELIRTLKGHTRAIRALQFDQMLLFTASLDGTVRIWNWRSGDCLRVLTGHTDSVVSLNFNANLLASGSADSTIRVWNFRNGHTFTLRGHDDWVNSVLLWDGKSSSGDMDPTVPTSLAQPRGTSPAPDSANMDIEPGTLLFSASNDTTVKLWDLHTQTCLQTFSGHRAAVQGLKVIVIDAIEGEDEDHHYTSGASTRNGRSTAHRAITPVSASSAASSIVPASIASLTPSGPSIDEALAVAPPGFDPLAFRQRSSEDPVEHVAHSHQDHPHDQPSKDKNKVRKGEAIKKAVLVTASLDGVVKTWDVAKNVEMRTHFGHIEGVWGVDVDALRIASGSHDRTVKVWDRESGKCVQTLEGHRAAVTSLQLSDDMIVSGSDDGDVIVWSFAPEGAKTV